MSKSSLSWRPGFCTHGPFQVPSCLCPVQSCLGCVSTLVTDGGAVRNQTSPTFCLCQVFPRLLHT